MQTPERTAIAHPVGTPARNVGGASPTLDLRTHYAVEHSIGLRKRVELHHEIVILNDMLDRLEHVTFPVLEIERFPSKLRARAHGIGAQNGPAAFGVAKIELQERLIHETVKPPEIIIRTNQIHGRDEPHQPRSMFVARADEKLFG